MSARDEGAFHFSIYGFTLSALARYYTFLVHKTRILFPFEVMILYVAQWRYPRCALSNRTHHRTSAHTRGHTARISAPTCTAQGRCFIHTSRSCTVKYGFGSQAWRREQIVAPPSNPRGLGGVRYLLLELWRRCKPSRFVLHASNPGVPRLFQLDASHLA